MRVAKVNKEANVSKYSKALLLTEGRKTCTNLAKNTNDSHDSIYQNFRNPIPSINIVSDDLISIAKRELKGENVYLILDDLLTIKQYSNEIEGVDVGFDGNTGRSAPGLQMVTALLTDNNVKIPINVMPYISKQLACADFKTKSEIAAQISTLLFQSFKIDTVLADAHYATKFFLHFLHNQKQPYLMKIPCNRIVTIGESSGQLRNILKFKKNQRITFAKDSFDGLSCHFYRAKLKTGAKVCFISMNEIDPYKVIELYKIRWKIELFHRTAKQSLGWKDCQMKSIEKQQLHALYVMHSYAIADCIRLKMNFSCVEEAIRLLRAEKMTLA